MQTRPGAWTQKLAIQRIGKLPAVTMRISWKMPRHPVKHTFNGANRFRKIVLALACKKANAPIFLE